MIWSRSLARRGECFSLASRRRVRLGTLSARERPNRGASTRRGGLGVSPAKPGGGPSQVRVVAAREGRGVQAVMVSHRGADDFRVEPAQLPCLARGWVRGHRAGQRPEPPHVPGGAQPPAAKGFTER